MNLKMYVSDHRPTGIATYSYSCWHFVLPFTNKPLNTAFGRELRFPVDLTMVKLESDRMKTRYHPRAGYGGFNEGDIIWMDIEYE